MTENKTVYIRQATKEGHIECAVGGVADLSYPESKTRRGRVQGGGNICPPIKAESKGICRIESAALGDCSMRESNDTDNHIVWGGLQEHQCPRNDGISPALTAAMGMGGGMTPIFAEMKGETSGMDGKNEERKQTGTCYRIRKLTPRECWRLMDFSDEDFEKAENVNSNTQLYKQAGNSIVCNVLVAIMGQMFRGKETVYRERGEVKQ